ncbi:hypothetical protein M2281_002385 [Mesorhizobium soli]|nr:hypothetical protein [Mesorhizobium soli]
MFSNKPAISGEKTGSLRWPPPPMRLVGMFRLGSISVYEYARRLGGGDGRVGRPMEPLITPDTSHD